jgi:AraC family transcriptional regulator, regulatory protein of adaptative response / methylated-DNA-[protein]-cysteine methyltransferase
MQSGPALSLEDLAARMRMSPAHFQRVFSQWVGVSPKRYQQYLTLGHARRLLAERHTMLGTALETGLSGTGRLHDLFLTWEAMSPGDYARGGDGLTIRWGWFESPFGRALVMATEKGICGMGFADEAGAEATLEDLTVAGPRRPIRRTPWPCALWSMPPSGPGRDRTPPDRRTRSRSRSGRRFWPFPSGHVTTYADIAGAIGHPTAHRAVGTAVGRNPISFLIPCHRALRRDGGLGGYHWGLPRKRAMLAWEAARTGMRDGRKARASDARVRPSSTQA